MAATDKFMVSQIEKRERQAESKPYSIAGHGSVDPLCNISKQPRPAKGKN